MRPRVFPAEDRLCQPVQPERRATSMRPRVFPAEDGLESGDQEARADYFNEAAGIPRGRRAEDQATYEATVALQ